MRLAALSLGLVLLGLALLVLASSCARRGPRSCAAPPPVGGIVHDLACPVPCELRDPGLRYESCGCAPRAR